MIYSTKEGHVFGYDDDQIDLYNQRISNEGHHKLDEYVSQETNNIPSFITKAQGKASLIRAGLLQGVVDFVNSISDPVEKAVAEVALNDTTHWQRSSPFLNSAAKALGLTDEQLDQLFIDASKIEL